MILENLRMILKFYSASDQFFKGVYLGDLNGGSAIYIEYKISLSVNL